MFRFCRKQKGLISVFLCGIMLPMMILSWVLIDASRMQLVKEEMQSAGDLTLNTALTQYDKVLKDVYGIFATSQSDKELFANLEDYYTRSMMSAGMDSETSILMSQNIISGLSNILSGKQTEEDYIDFLQTELVSFKQIYDPAYAVASPNVMREQILEFMKYRAPIGACMEIVDAIKAFGTMSEQTKVVEKKTEYYKEQEALEEHLMKAWAGMEAYRDLLVNGNAPDAKVKEKGLLNATEFSNNDAAFSKIKTNFSSGTPNVLEHTVYELLIQVPDKYADLMVYKKEKLVSNHYFNRITALEETVTRAPAVMNNHAEPEYDEDDDSWSLTDDQKEAVKAFKNGIKTVEANLDNLEKYWNAKSSNNGLSLSELYEYGEKNYKEFDEKNAVAFVTAVNKRMDFVGGVARNSRDNKAETLKQTQEELKNVCSNFKKIPEEYFDEKYDESCDTVYNKLIGYCDRYEGLANKYYTLTVKFSNAAHGDYHEKHFGNTATVAGYVENLKTLKDLREQLNRAYNDTLFDSGYIYDAIKHLESAKKAVEDVEKARKEWKTASEADALNGTNFQTETQQEISSLEGKFKAADIQKLLDKMNAIKDVVLRVEDEVKKYKLYDKYLYDITDIVNVYDIIKNNNNINDYNGTYVKSQLEPLHADVKSHFSAGNINKEDGKKLEFTEMGKLFDYLNITYKNASREVYSGDFSADENRKSKEAAKEEEEQAKDSAKNAATDATSGIAVAIASPASVKLGSTAGINPQLPSSIYAEAGGNDAASKLAEKKEIDEKKISGSGDAASGFFSKVLDAAKEMGGTFAENLYITEYVMGMFTHQTSEREVAIDLVKKSEADFGDTLSDQLKFRNLYLYKDDGTNAPEFAGLPKEIDMNAIRAELVTLTHEDINPKNNYAYLNEVEYIIYGDGGTDTAHNVIMAIRMLANTISAFMNSEIQSIADMVATACFGTPPLTFLIPVAKIAITFAFAIGETAMDMQLLLAGQKVPIYKNDDDWIVSPTNALGEAGKMLFDITKEKINATVDDAMDTLTELVNLTSDDLKNLTDEERTKAEKALKDCYDAQVGVYIEGSVNSVVVLCEETIQKLRLENVSIENTEIANKVKAQILAWVKGNSSDNTLEGKARQLVGKAIVNTANNAVASYVDPLINALIAKYNGTLNRDNGLIKLQDVPKEIKTKAYELIENGTDTIAKDIKGMIDGAQKSLDSAIQSGGEGLKSMIGDSMDDLFTELGGDASSETKMSGTSLLSLSYSGYLKIMLMVALTGSPRTVEARIGDVIQLNMQKRTSNKNYTLSNAYAYVGLKIESEMEPLFFGFDGIAGYLGTGEDKMSKLEKAYIIKYEGLSGY